MRRFLLRLLVFLLLFYGLSEVVLRWIVPATVSPKVKMNYEYDFQHYDNTYRPDARWTSGRLADVRADYHVNNHGWISDEDYLPPEQRGKPLIAYFGSSFVQQLYVSVGRHISDKLEAMLDQRWDVYNFGYSDAVASEYLGVSRWVEDELDPQVLVYFVGQTYIAGSFENDPYRNRFELENGQVYETQVARAGRFSRRTVGHWIKSIPLLSYIFLNARVPLDISPGHGDAIVQNAATPVATSEVDSREVEKTRLGMEYFCRELREIHGDKPMLIVLGGVHRVGWNEPQWNETLLTMKEIAHEHGFATLFLNRITWEDYQEHGQRFDFPDDPHWNEHANDVIADALYEKLTELGWVSADSGGSSSSPAQPSSH